MRCSRQIALAWLCLLGASSWVSDAQSAQEIFDQLPLDESTKSPDLELNLKAQGLIDRGNAAYQARNFDEAVANYSELIKLKPNDPRAYYNRGNAYNKLGELEHAMADFSQVISLDPTFYLALMNRGNIYSKRRLYNEAIADYDRAIILKPDDFLIVYNRGVANRALGHLDEALRDFTKAIELNHEDAQSYAERGIAFLEQQKFDEARGDLLFARKLDPDNARAAAGLEIFRKRMRLSNPNTTSVWGLIQRQQILSEWYELADATCFSNGEEPHRLREIATEKNWTAQDAEKLAQASTPDAQVINGWVATTNFGEIAVIQSKYKAAPAAFTCSITVKLNQVASLEEVQTEFKKHFKAATPATEFAQSPDVARYWIPHNSKCDTMTAIVFAPASSLLTIRMLHGRLRGEAI